MSLFFRYCPSPVGRLKLVASDVGLVAVLWENDDPKRVPLGAAVEADSNQLLAETERQLSEYFAGTRQEFSVPLDLRGTAFQQSVWNALLAIPFGSTRTYGDLAKQLGSPAGRCRQWAQPRFYHRAVPPRDWLVRQVDGLCRRAPCEAAPVGAGIILPVPSRGLALPSRERATGLI